MAKTAEETAKEQVKYLLDSDCWGDGPATEGTDSDDDKWQGAFCEAMSNAQVLAVVGTIPGAISLIEDALAQYDPNSEEDGEKAERIRKMLDWENNRT